MTATETVLPPSATLSPARPAGRSWASLPALLALASVLIALLFILRSYPQLSQTWDEPAHIGTGMEWLAKGTYTLDLIDPPLARVSTALGPYLLGSRPVGDKNPWTEGTAIINASPHPYKTLVAARLGILPYFLIAAFLTWSMTKRWLGPWPAVVATALFATCPPVLAHAGLATTDMTFVAMFLLALDRLWLAMERPGAVNSLLAGAGVGLACISKLSGAPYVALCFLAFLVYFFWTRRSIPHIKDCALAVLALFFTIWAGYHFDIVAIGSRDPEIRQKLQHALVKLGPLRSPATVIASHFPAWSYVQSIRAASFMSKHPPEAYLFGHLYTGGHWYFFLFLLLVKTPLPFLLLGLSGIMLGIRQLFKARDGFALVPLAGICCPILVATLSHVNLGVRHVLVVYPFLAMLSALSFLKLRSAANSRWIAPSLVSALLVWQLCSCIRISPDFLAYLNEPASPWTGYICTDSDLDWGQDIGHLSTRLKQLNAQHLWIAYSGSADLRYEHLPAWDTLPPGQHETGWIAVSETWARWYPERYGWLPQQDRVGTAGRTIRIYYVP